MDTDQLKNITPDSRALISMLASHMKVTNLNYCLANQYMYFHDHSVYILFLTKMCNQKYDAIFYYNKVTKSHIKHMD